MTKFYHLKNAFFSFNSSSIKTINSYHVFFTLWVCPVHYKKNKNNEIRKKKDLVLWGGSRIMEIFFSSITPWLMPAIHASEALIFHCNLLPPSQKKDSITTPPSFIIASPTILSLTPVIMQIFGKYSFPWKIFHPNFCSSRLKSRNFFFITRLIRRRDKFTDNSGALIDESRSR